MSSAVSSTSIGIFDGACGENSYATSERGLQVNSTVQLNGNTNLSDCIKANDRACVYGITLTGSPGIYDYVINVDAQGPSGFGSGSMYLYFTDETGDRYSLSIYSSTRATHTVRYNSKKPSIFKIEWSNTSL
jgi:hypothetical protein